MTTDVQHAFNIAYEKQRRTDYWQAWLAGAAFFTFVLVNSFAGWGTASMQGNEPVAALIALGCAIQAAIRIAAIPAARAAMRNYSKAYRAAKTS